MQPRGDRLPLPLRRLRRTRELAAALTHPSLSGPKTRATRHLRHRLELLGDAIWNLAVIHHLLRERAAPRAELARRKAQLAGAPFMADVARRAGLGRALRIGSTPDAASLRERPSVLAGTLEAILAAWYLQGGLAPVLRFVGAMLTGAKRRGALGPALDPKSELQQVVTRSFHILPTYRVLEQRGSAHAPEFVVDVVVNDTPIGRGSGSSRRAAEQVAAKAALEVLKAARESHKI